MKKSFTFSKTALLGGFATLLCLFLTQSAIAQNAEVVITAPSGVAGSYVAQAGAFGPTACDLNVSGMFGIADDGTDNPTEACNPLTNDLTGLIALIDRGSCNFSLKCYNAQAAGAIAAVVCNNVDDPIITMAAGDSASLITIPCVMISRQDCATIRAEVGNGLDGGVQAVSIEEDDTINVLWGDNPGEGDFDGGLNGWTTANASCANGATDIDTWAWTADGSVQGSCGGYQIISPSACNGAAGFASDFLDSGDNDCGSGLGECGAPQMGELISPVIDLSNADVSGVSLRWWQGTRQFTSSYFIGYTIDGGETWTDIPVNEDRVTNEDANSEARQVFLPGAAGSAQLQVRFRYEANYYYWIVDDVKIVETEANNLQVDPFFAIPNNAVVPASQVEPVYFLADVRNIGSQPQTNVNLNMTVTDENGMVVYSDDLAYNTIEAATIVENIPFNNAWTPPSEVGTYTGTYTISADSTDFDASNNTQTFTMIVSDTTFAKETGATRFLQPAQTNWDEGAPRSWGMGNVFHVVNGTSTNELPYYVSTVTVGIGNRTPGLVGQTITVWIYEWEDANSDDIIQENERTRAGIGFLEFDGDGSGDPTSIEYTIPVENFNAPGTPIYLNDNTNYVVFMEYTDTDPAPDEDIDFELVASDDFDYSAQVFMNAPANEDANGNPTGLAIGEPRYAPALAIPMDGSFASGVEITTTAFGRDIVPVVRMNILEEEPDNTNELSDDNIINIFPNPTTDKLNVQLDLVNVAEDLNVRIIDTNGKILEHVSYSNIQQENTSFDVRQYASGTYFLVLNTKAGVKMKKFVVQH